MAGLSAIDIALWDIRGKHLGLPVHTLLGGKKTKVIQPYATGLYFTGEPGKVEGLKEKLVTEAVGYKQQGFRALKGSVPSMHILVPRVIT